MNQDNLEYSRQQRLEIDRAARWPCGVFIGTSLFWLIFGSVLAIAASIKLHDPEFLADNAWLTFGRVRPAHLNTVAYGWLSTAGIGIGLWILSRLCRAPIEDSRSLTLAAVLWNMGNAVGTWGILRGDSTAVEWLEYPTYAAPFLLVSFAFVTLAAVNLIRRREPGHIYISQWYIMAAFFWFPMLFFTAHGLLVLAPVQAPAQPPINWWFAHNALGLWFTPIGLGAAYYLIPKIIGKPIHSYYLSAIGFWTLAFFYAWNGMHHLIGGPYPAWLITASVVASVMMFVPVITVAINHHFTMVGHFKKLIYSPTLRFVVFGAMSYTLVSFQGSLMAIRSVNHITHFTHYTIAHAHLGAYAFASMTFFGAIYYMMPRLLQREWPSRWLIRLHFWPCAIGIILYWTILSYGGWLQGLELNKDTTPFLEIVQLTLPYLKGRTHAGMLMTFGHICFAISFVWMLIAHRQERSEPTLFTKRKPSPINS
ncbi:cbb3-type cytochrome c oxidase subunit I [Roseibacillus persicicus]|uniref:cbb3-type cytochrome c oxidase subunit I n=1 Tax=Roseibacillus persicicus TaxID=454148 RepID=UPI00280F11CD|nr:cbb3-type cytochrome c oxidase subunit I [Roseibacillus persicicus]MDQ8190321.1 cbb3-type cytochrome c oxidase subunit I [Roseibacillus persicicus]